MDLRIANKKDLYDYNSEIPKVRVVNENGKSKLVIECFIVTAEAQSLENLSIEEKKVIANNFQDISPNKQIFTDSINVRVSGDSTRNTLTFTCNVSYKPPYTSGE